MYFVNTRARYKLFDWSETFSVNYSAIFNTMKFTFEQVGAFNWESHTIYVGVSYRFGDGKYCTKSSKRGDDNEK